MQTPDPLAPDKRQVRRSFGRAAACYDQYADLQRRVGLSLLQRLDLAPERVAVALDVGSGTGYFLPRLAAAFPGADLLAVDLAEEMLGAGRRRCAAAGFVCGDVDALPLPGGCADLVYSNLALQWCSRVSQPLAEFFRVLRPGGVAAFSVFGAGTLGELRQAWRAVDGYRRVNDFVTAEELRAALVWAGFVSVDLQARREAGEYAAVGDLLRELKGLGANNASGDRPRHMTGKAALARMESAYRELMAGGPIRASYEVIGVVAHKP